MKFEISIISILLLLQISSSQLTLKTTIENVDVPLEDDFKTTANGRYLIHTKDISIHKIYDLNDGTETTASNNDIYGYTTIPNTDKILEFTSLGQMEIYTLPDLTLEETITPTGESLSSSYLTGIFFFSEDGDTLYIVGDDSIQSIDFSGNTYAASAEVDFSSQCSSVNSGLVQHYPYPGGNKVALIDQDYNTCVVDYSDMSNVTAEEGQHTEDAGTLTTFGVLDGDKSAETSDSNYAQVLIFNLLTGSKIFTYTFGTEGAYAVHNGLMGNYWTGQLYTKEFIVVNGENLCQYQATPQQFSKSKSSYWFQINTNVLIITESDNKIYTYDIGSQWQEMDECTSSSAQLGDISQDGLNLFPCSMIALLLLSLMI